MSNLSGSIILGGGGGVWGREGGSCFSGSLSSSSYIAVMSCSSATKIYNSGYTGNFYLLGRAGAGGGGALYFSL